MADLNIGASNTRRFHNGGLFIISDATNNYTIKKIRSGSLRIREGRRSVAKAADQGEQLRPTLGDKNYTMLDLDVAFVDEHGADSLQDLMSLAAVTDDLVPEYTVQIVFPDAIGASTGQSVTYPLTHFSEGFSLDGSADGEYADTTPIRMESRTSEGVWADYAAV